MLCFLGSSSINEFPAINTKRPRQLHMWHGARALLTNSPLETVSSVMLCCAVLFACMQEMESLANCNGMGGLRVSLQPDRSVFCSGPPLIFSCPSCFGRTFYKNHSKHPQVHEVEKINARIITQEPSAQSLEAAITAAFRCHAAPALTLESPLTRAQHAGLATTPSTPGCTVTPGRRAPCLAACR